MESHPSHALSLDACMESHRSHAQSLDACKESHPSHAQISFLASQRPHRSHSPREKKRVMSPGVSFA
eukprot:12913217-Prorocentrum_lima.AAC.1